MKIPESERTTFYMVHQIFENEKPRLHLGASMLGHPCDRHLWLSFRWAVAIVHTPRTRRIFRRGEREEEVIVSDLRKAGINVWECLHQQKFIDFGWHVGGSPDGLCSGLPEAMRKVHILECKTHNDASFKDVEKHGVEKSKPMHFVQAQCYMYGKQVDRALYYAVNKNDDSLYLERLRLSKPVAEKAIERGQRITKDDRMPPPLSTDRTWWQCKMCIHHGFCHVKKVPQVHCRTCAHMTVREHDIYCERWQAAIPPDAQYDGCRSHVIHPDMTDMHMEEVDQWNCSYDGNVNGENGLSSNEILHGVAGMIMDVFGGEVI